MENQIIKMLNAGHEIGLHIHPQWIESEFDGDKFTLYPEHQTISDVYKSENDIRFYFKERLDRLQDLIIKNGHRSEIICYRAGGRYREQRYYQGNSFWSHTYLRKCIEYSRRWWYRRRHDCNNG